VLETFVDLVGDTAASPLLGLAVGMAFGLFAQKSRFCLRSAVIEFAHGAVGPKVSVWLLTFATALFGTQALVALGALDVSETRQLAQQGSLSGSLIGGLLFGCGMILSRGCASRLLVLSANGNLRALMSGLVFAVAAQAAYRGVLAPLREWITGLWLVDGGPKRDLVAAVGGGTAVKLAIATLWLAAAVYYARRARLGAVIALGAVGAGFAVVLGWLATDALSKTSFLPISIKSLTFSGPSADVLMWTLVADRLPDFDLAIVPGVFLGSFLAAATARELRLEGFRDGEGMRRSIAGAVLMGFGAMLAGGCAVGAGITGGSAYALTAWVALTGMWIAAALTDVALDRR